MFAKFKSNIFLIFGLYSFELAHGLLNLIREVSSFSTLLISLLLRLIEVEEKEESKKSVPFQHNKYILRIQPHSAFMIMTMVRNVSSLRLPLPGQSWRQMVGGQNKQMEPLTKPRHNNRAEWPEWAQ